MSGLGSVVDSVPRPVVCVTEGSMRDLEVARAARSGRFVHGGVARQLGRRPDWLGGGPAADPEWRIEWVKLYEGQHLAYAFATTGDPSFLDTWQDLVESFCDQVPVGYDSSDVSARRLQNWLYAWQAFAAAPAYPGLRAGLADRLAERMRADADHLAAHLTAERNHRTLELYSLFLVGLALDRPTTALADLAANAATDVWADGVHRECSTDYHVIVLRSLLGAIANARHAGLPVPPDLIAAADRACDFALHVQRPDGSTPALSDGDPADHRPVLRLGAELLDRPDLAWAASGGRRGSPPARRSVSFPVGGYHVQRSGWRDHDERWLVLDCGPLGDGGHGHYDQLSVEVAAGGRVLLVDPGRYTYVDGPDRRWFKGTAGHNTVCVDGLDQTPYRAGKPARGTPTSSARLLGRWIRPGLDVLRGEVRSPCYDAVHTRTVAFVDDAYWIVHDRLRAPTPHSYAARWHLGPGPVALGGDRVSTSDVTLLATGGRVTVADGWVSPEYGVKVPAPVAVVAAAGRDADLVTVIVPGGTPGRVEAGPDEVRVRRPGAGLDTVRLSGEPGWEREPC